MSNMSYCRFENTSGDLADCCYAIEEAIENETSADDFRADLSSDHERFGLKHTIEQCQKFLALCEELGLVSEQVS